MNAGKAISLKTGLLTACATLAMLAFGPTANATVVRINFSSGAGSGYADLTLATDPNANGLYKPKYDADLPGSLSSDDPTGAQYITHASGSFNGVAITGIEATNPSTPPPGETLPASFSWFAPGTSAQASYDNLFYPNGSPLVCPPIPPDPYIFSGGFLDIYGVMFALDNGSFVALWSDGVVPPGYAGTTGGLTFGLSVFTPTDGGYEKKFSQFAGATAAVPAPDFVWILGAVLLGLFAWRRSREWRRVRRID